MSDWQSRTRLGPEIKMCGKRAVGGEQRTLWLASVVRENLYEFVIREGMKALDTMLEQDRERLCGPAGSKSNGDEPVRWGSTDGRMVMGGRRVIVCKSRVRKAGKEVPLPTWEQFGDEDPLNERTVEQMVIGVSIRNYERSTDPLPTNSARTARARAPQVVASSE